MVAVALQHDRTIAKEALLPKLALHRRTRIAVFGYEFGIARRASYGLRISGLM